ncbi:tetratricopeptide repeat-containing sensor histidine kinase [Pontimicrobium sp. MEBiC01747]
MRNSLIFLYLFISLLGYSQTKDLEQLTIDLAFKQVDSTKVNTCLEIIKLYHAANDYDLALKYIEQSEKLSKDLNYNKGLAETLYLKALITAKKEEHIKAINYYTKAKRLYTDLNDSLIIAKINSKLGVLKIKTGNYREGIVDALSGIQELEHKKLYRDLAYAYKNLAKAYQYTNALDDAIIYYLKSLEKDNLLKDSINIIVSSKNLADLYLKKQEFNDAIGYYTGALEYIKRTDTVLKAQIFPKLGKAYVKTKRYALAKKTLNEGLKLNRILKNDNGILMSLNNLGALSFLTKNYVEADDYLLEAGNIGRVIDNREELLSTYLLHKTLDSTTNNFKRAFAWQREYYKLKDKIEISKKETISNTIVKAINDSINVAALAQKPITNIKTPPKAAVVVDNKENISRLKLVFYTLLAAFAIALIFFVPAYLKRNNQLKYTRELEEKNQKIEQQNEAILEQSKYLESINHVKDKLFSIVSHDLKDSLTSTQGFIDLLKEGSLSDEEFNSLLPELSDNANNASLLLFNLLNWSKSQMQSLEAKPSLFDIQEVFEDKLKLVEQKIITKGINLINNTTREYVFADRSMVEIIIQNLLANAVKFCENGDSITINNKTSVNSKAIISIADSGIGISKENQDKLFNDKAFSTVGTNNEKGTGLGLTICKEMVELNQGRIWVDSELKKGSTFYIELPKSKTGYSLLN